MKIVNTLSPKLSPNHYSIELMILLFGSYHEKTFRRAFRPGPTQTRLKDRDCALFVAKTMALISCAVTTQLIWAFVVAYAKSRVSHDSLIFSWQMSKDQNWGVMVSHRSGETEDTFIADLVVGLCTGQVRNWASLSVSSSQF